MMWQDEQVHLHTTDQDLRHLKALLINHMFQINYIPKLFAHYHSLKIKDMQHKF